MPKILRIINRFNLGGITYNVSYLSKHLSSEFDTLLIGGPEEASEESSLFIPRSMGLEPQLIVELRRSIDPLQDFYAFRRIRRIIKAYKPDIVHTHASKAGAIGRLAAISCGVPVIVHTFHGHVFHGYFGAFKTSLVKLTERFLASRSTAIVAISEIQKKELCATHKICPPEKIHVIPLGFDLSRFTIDQEAKRRQFRERYRIKDSDVAIVIIGRLAPIKNHFLFIDSILHLSESGLQNIRAFIVGDGEMRVQLEEYCRKRSIGYTAGPGTALITFTGWIREADKPLAGSDLVCLTSDNEGTPVSLIEAQAAGKFVVSTNVGGIRDILDPRSGLLSEPGDEQQFRDHLLKAVKSLHFFSKEARQGSAGVAEKFSYRRLCREMEQLYLQLLGHA